MNLSILNRDIQKFINDNLDVDLNKLILKKNVFRSVSSKEIVQQIEAKIKTRQKLPTWFNASNIYYPNKLNIEQTSSEVSAQYKAELVSGNTIIDLTGGLGIDSFYFAKTFKNVTHCEIDTNLSKIAEHNFKVLNIDNITCLNEDGLDYLTDNTIRFDAIYIDPSRRHNYKGKVFFLRDCIPNVPENLDTMFDSSDTILIKTSPMLDSSQAISELRCVKSVHVVAINNEVKELLFLLEKAYKGLIKINTINFAQGEAQKFSFYKKDEELTSQTFSEVKKYLYEPNVAILKSGAFKLVSKKFKLFKLHQHTHLYTSEQLVKFPGRRFKVEKLLPYNKKQLKSELGLTKANITTRNFPISVKNIRKTLQIKDGGTRYLFFTTDLKNKKIVIVTSKA